MRLRLSKRQLDLLYNALSDTGRWEGNSYVFDTDTGDLLDKLYSALKKEGSLDEPVS